MVRDYVIRRLSGVGSNLSFSSEFVLCADFGWYTWKPKDEDTYAEKVDSELLNGRLAMMACGGIFTQAVLTGKGFPFI